MLSTEQKEFLLMSAGIDRYIGGVDILDDTTPTAQLTDILTELDNMPGEYQGRYFHADGSLTIAGKRVVRQHTLNDLRAKGVIRG
jgi:hypothetical protein